MIKLSKAGTPPVLSKNADKWLLEFEAALAKGDKKAIGYRKSRYNHVDIKTAVVNETGGKCAYCEADVVATSHGDIEHIYPKSLDVTKTFEWANLGFACQKCNQNKSDTDPKLEKIIDPYNVDPEPFIVFYCSFINGNDTAQGLNTINLLGLKRAELAERRAGVIDDLIKSINAIKKATDAETKEALIADFEANELGACQEFSAMRRDFWKAFKPL